MRQQELRRHHWRYPVGAGLIALVMVAGLFAIRGITPFGDHNLLIGDLGVQYIPFFTDFVRLVRGHGTSLFNFHQALGGSWMPIISYYLMSPFNSLLFLVHSSQIPVMVAVIIMLKIATMAGTMTVYLQSHWQFHHAFVMVFGLAYAFCGFVTVNFFNVMWLDALIWLPSVAWGLDNFVATRRGGAYFGWLFVAVLTDYYLGYMTCLFVMGYFVYLMLGTKLKGQTIREWWVQERGLIGRFIVTSLLSVGSTLALLLPTILNMLTTAKAHPGSAAFSLFPTFGLEFFRQFSLGTTDFSQRIDHAPALYVSSLVILLAMAYFGLKSVTRWDKVRATLLLLFLFLGMWLRGFNTFWHMMALPAGYPFRNSFFFSFVLIMLAAGAWQHDIRQLTAAWRWLPLLLAGLMVGGTLMIAPMQTWTQSAYYASLEPISRRALLASVGLLLVTAVVLWHGPKYRGLLALLVVGELVANFGLALNGIEFGHQRAYAQAAAAAAKRLAPLTQRQSLSRIRNEAPTVAAGFTGHYNPYNDSVWMGYNGTGAYSSTMTATTVTLSRQLGLFSRNLRRVSTAGFSPVSELLFGIRDKVRPSGTIDRVATYSGMGFAVPDRLIRVRYGTDAIANQEATLQALRPRHRPYFYDAKTISVKTWDNWRSVDQLAVFKYHHRWTMTAQATGHLYWFDQSGTSKYSSMRVNGQHVHPEYFADGRPVLLDLGTFTKGQPVTVTFASWDEGIRAIHIATLPAAGITAIHRQLRATALDLTQQHTVPTSYQGQLVNQTDQRWAYLSLPTETGWHITVNGQLVPTKTVLTGLTAVPIRSGINDIQVQYRVPGGRLGVIVALVCFLSYLDLWHFRRL